MALVLLSIDRTTFTDLNRRADKGDQDALNEVASYFDPYPDPISCFLCDEDVSRPPPIFSMILPERNAPDRLLMLPLCSACRSLNPSIRWAKTIKMLKAIWSHSASEKAGKKKTITFQRRNPHQYPH
jgi:hypothetical protein